MSIFFLLTVGKAHALLSENFSLACVALKVTFYFQVIERERYESKQTEKILKIPPTILPLKLAIASLLSGWYCDVFMPV